tara:strand:- start:138 stop:419 length:282 start_codon:yes stop_codon:yes gene_type:complete
MGKKKKDFKLEILSKKQEEELQSIVSKLIDIAADTVQEYDNIDLTELAELSGSITQIHEDSPFLKEVFQGDSWKKVIGSLPEKPIVKKDKDVD